MMHKPKKYILIFLCRGYCAAHPEALRTGNVFVAVQSEAAENKTDFVCCSEHAHPTGVPLVVRGRAAAAPQSHPGSGSSRPASLGVNRGTAVPPDAHFHGTWLTWPLPRELKSILTEYN